MEAVIIAAPDHWHKQMLIDALAAGKDVYVEKPVTHSVEEAPVEIEAVERSGRIVQTGTQQRVGLTTCRANKSSHRAHWVSCGLSKRSGT